MKIDNLPSWLLVWAITLLATGCGLGPDSSDYGSTSYPSKSTSINGLGVFEELCKQAGSRCIVTNRLSSRLEKVDAIILIGDSFHPPAKEARDWLEEWLAHQPGRSVVYFGRDFDADLYYREQTLDQVPDPARRRARLDLMNARMQLDTQLLQQIPDDVFCRWFTLRIHQPRRDVKPLGGPWAEALAGESGTWPVRVVLDPPDQAQQADKPKWPTPQTTTATQATPAAATAEESEEEEEVPVVFTSQWNEFDIGDEETWESEWEKAPEAELLLVGADDTPLVTRLTSERYPNSQILTIVNGAPFLNGTLVQPHFRKIAHRIIEDLQPAKRIAFLPFTEYGILVSRLEGDEDEVAGLTVLTTWPMNIIVAHLAFLGILICLALFPILGRPQNLRPRSLADFGQHAESLGQMLQRAGDLGFALRTLADYYRTVRGEAVPSWIESALQQMGLASSMPAGSPLAPPTTQTPAAGDAPPSMHAAQTQAAQTQTTTASPASDMTLTDSPADREPPTSPHTDPSA